MKTPVFFALNRNLKTVCELSGFSCWEHVQSAFRCGILMPDGNMANGIGRLNRSTLEEAARKDGFALLS